MKTSFAPHDTPITVGLMSRFLNLITGDSLPRSNGGGASQSRKMAAGLLAADESVDIRLSYKPNDKILGKELARAVQFLPEQVIKELEKLVQAKSINPDQIEEVMADKGRSIKVYHGQNNHLGAAVTEILPNYRVTAEDIARIQAGIKFNQDTLRGGLSGEPDLSRHSLSYRAGNADKVTIRIGREIEGQLPAEIKNVVVDAVRNNKKVLFLGQVGVGKTTLLRDIANYLSREGLSPTVFDKSGEVAGHAPVPHSIVGRLTRVFGVQPFKDVTDSLINMMENHRPSILMIDELSDKRQFQAVSRAVNEKGIKTAFIFTHGTTLAQAMNADGGHKELFPKIEAVAVSDETAGLNGDKLQYKVVGPSTVDVVIEMPARGVFVVHPNAADSMKRLAAGKEAQVDIYPKGTNIRNYRSPESESFLPIDPARSARLAKRHSNVRVSPNAGAAETSQPEKLAKERAIISVPVLSKMEVVIPPYTKQVSEVS